MEAPSNVALNEEGSRKGYILCDSNSDVPAKGKLWRQQQYQAVARGRSRSEEHAGAQRFLGK